MLAHKTVTSTGGVVLLVLILLVSQPVVFAQKVNPRTDLASILAEAGRAPYADGELLVEFG